MIIKAVKIGALAVVGLAIVGALGFGTDLFSYAGSTARSVRLSVKDSVPIEFELQRAGDLLNQILPEMQANIRLIAQEEVEVAALKRDIEHSRSAMEQERTKVARLRDVLSADEPMYQLAGHRYSREYVTDELARRFDAVKEAEVALATKQRLLESRRRSLEAAMQMLERTKTRKAQLEDQIVSLESQYRLVRAASVGSQFQLDASKLAQTERLIGEIKKRLDVAERVLAHEAKFTGTIPLDVVSEADLLAQVDDYLGGGRTAGTQPAGESIALGSR
jgi:hypothetical protein